MTNPSHQAGLTRPDHARSHVAVVRTLALLACTCVGALTLMIGATGPAAADAPDPTTIGIPSGQSITLTPNPLGISGQSGLTGTLLNKIPDFSVNLLIIQCGSSMSSDGTLWCGTKGKPTTSVPSRPTPTPAPTSKAPKTPKPPAHPAAGNRGPSTASGATDATPRAADAVTASGAVPRAHLHAHHKQHRHANQHGHRHTQPAAEHRTTQRPASDRNLLILAASAVTMLGFVGSGGIARASTRTWHLRYPRAARGTEGEVVSPDSEMYDFDPDAGGPGDRSRVWGFVAGWAVLDRLSRLAPFRLAKRVPLVARVFADAPYLRAILGAGSLVLIGVAFVLGMVCAHDTDGFPLAPSLTLTVVLVVIASLDATAGLGGVVGFVLGVLVWGPGDLGFGPSLRSFLGLAALWFAIPLIASTARPLRRTVETRSMYGWDRLGDGVIAALIGGWAVQDAVNGLAGLSGHLSPISTHANTVALWAVGALLVRVGLEEVAARLFPERLKVVDSGPLPEPTVRRDLLSALVRVAIFAFVTYAFLGDCWQLWVSGLLFALPELLDLIAERLPNWPGLYALIPRGVALVLFLLVVELLVTVYANHTFGHDDLLRNAFVLLMVPECVITLMALFGREGADPGRAWTYEALGAAAVVGSIALALAA